MNKWLRRAAAGLLAAAVFTATAGFGFLRQPDLSVSDFLYQERSASDGQIVLVGIDQRALEDIGPFQTWGRDVMARALEYLNASEDCRPAAIGIDVLFSGETQAESDQWLTEEAARYGNVVTAAAAQFGTSLVKEETGGFYMDQFSIVGYDEPFDELKKVTVQGHINAMFDGDGVLRHSLLEIRLPDGTVIPSFSMALASAYRSHMGRAHIERPPTDSRGFWYLPFTGRPGDFYEGISVADLLEGSVPAEYFDDKIVLIGPYAAGLQDSYVTSIDHAEAMYGVEYQANAITALLNGNYKKEAGDLLQLAILFFLVWACFLIFWRHPIGLSTAVWAVVAGGWFLLCKVFYSWGYVLHVLWVPFFVTLLYLISVAVNYAQSAVEKRKVTATFKRYVAPEIVNEILKEGTEALELGGKLCDIAVLFVDIRGFTAMSEVLEPRQMVEVLNRYLTLTSSCIMKYHGTLDKFVGDATMAFWGAPLPQEDYIMNAVRAALEMVKESRKMSEDLLEKYGRTVSYGIGINVGPAIVGNIGAMDRMDYTAIGDTVNTASRLESMAPGGKIYITRALADALEGRIEITSLGTSFKLKGKAKEVEILTLDGLSTPQ